MNNAAITECSVVRRSVHKLDYGHKQYRDGAAEPAELRLLPVTVTPDHPRGTASAGASELIEIVLAGGYRLRIGEGVQAATLWLVLDVLERR